MIEMLKARIREFFELPNLELDEDADLVALLSNADPDLFTDLLSEFERDFKVAMPRFDTPVVPTTDARSLIGRILDKIVGPDDGQPTHVVIDQITLRELAEIAAARRWPSRFAARYKS